VADHLLGHHCRLGEPVLSGTAEAETADAQLPGLLRATVDTLSQGVPLPGRLPEVAWVVFVSHSHSELVAGEFVSWHETEADADAESAVLTQGDGPPYYHVEQIARPRLEAFLASRQS
jgi:hypothetical protein